VVGKYFEIHLPQMAENALKLPTVVGENIEINLFQMAKMNLNFSPLLERILKFNYSNC